MTDRELLEWAAKVAGFDGLFWSERDDTFYAGELYDEEAESNADAIWNPLYDDGDALRLAVRMGLLVYVMADAGFTAIRLPDEHIGGKYDEVEMHGADPYAATRRAIVRAAAAIGQSLAVKGAG